ncbi:hypothetical protein BDEG_26220 [Batrachochytrium dendrobatidis JEL423]|uniref:Transmembrane 9 superfamily member n=1 Tax=Batrachochytrium dendrobatidis (strain JEL423) TaxID=403673 RepID=A0A177WRT0_BATDL|nr:hypothetical protein BDEG_26220 [Batrachochytrium dendrobatidis JEL423]
MSILYKSFRGVSWKRIAILGYKFPTGCRQIPRQIPQQPWYLDPVGIILIAGVFPFAVVYFELSFVFDTVWQMHHIQHFFGYVSIF